MDTRIEVHKEGLLILHFDIFHEALNFENIKNFSV